MSKQKQKKQHPTGPFIDGLDSYAEEFRKWKLAIAVRGLVGIYEFNEARYYSTSLEEKLALTSHPECEVLYYDVAVSNEESGKDQSRGGTGFAVAVRDQYGRVRPMIFLREEIRREDGTIEDDAEVIGVYKLFVLLHEFGHAEDITKGINYSHDTLSLDLVKAEVYAHEYACRHARKNGYRLGLAYYVDAIERAQESEEDSVRLPAIKFFEKHDQKDLRKHCSMSELSSNSKIASLMRRTGRMKDVLGLGRS